MQTRSPSHGSKPGVLWIISYLKKIEELSNHISLKRTIYFLAYVFYHFHWKLHNQNDSNLLLCNWQVHKTRGRLSILSWKSNIRPVPVIQKTFECGSNIPHTFKRQTWPYSNPELRIFGFFRIFSDIFDPRWPLIFHKLSRKKRIFKIGQNLTKLEAKM